MNARGKSSTHTRERVYILYIPIVRPPPLYHPTAAAAHTYYYFFLFSLLFSMTMAALFLSPQNLNAAVTQRTALAMYMNMYKLCRAARGARPGASLAQSLILLYKHGIVSRAEL
jgi:hypothetical protein